MTHLNAELWGRLRQGSLEPGERAGVLRHLTEGCEDCDDVVASLDSPELDCAIDAALSTLAPAPAEAGPVYHSVERRVLTAVFPKRRRLRTALPVAFAAAAAAVLVAVVNPWATRPGEQRLKGEALGTPALTAVVSVKKGAALEPLAGPRTYPTSAELYFTYDLPQDAHVYLGRIGIDGMVEPFYPPLGQSDAVEPAGLHSLTVGGTVHAYSLEGLRGKQRFVLLSSPVALSGPALQQALKEASAQSASLEVEVEGW